MDKVKDCPFLLVLPFCHKDCTIMLENVRFMRTLSKELHYQVLLTYDKATSPSFVKQIADEAELLFDKVHTYCYSPPENNPWPIPQNEAFQKTARYIAAFFTCSWFWFEADAIPLRPDWLDLIYNEYLAGKKPFMGHVVKGMGHMNGVGIYPNSISQFSTNALMCRTTAWDVAMSSQTTPHTHAANHLFQHVWTTDPDEVMTSWSKDGHITFPDWESVEKRIDFNCAIMHRNKDGTLIERLREHYWGANPTEKCVPQLEKESKPDSKLEVSWEPQVERKDGAIKCEILIVTYHKDLPWLEYCLKALDKYVSGFHCVTVLVPDKGVEKFLKVKKLHDIRLVTFKEEPKKGMLHHMAMICSADTVAQIGTTHVLHLDADCIFKKPTTPANYFSDGKPHYVVRTKKSLYSAKAKVWQDNTQWFPVVEKALGYEPEFYGMCRHPTIYPVELYKPLRDAVEKNTKKNFLDYVLSCKGNFPQGFAEFPTMGAFAMKHASDRFFWIDCSNGLSPEDRQKTYWSHGGLNQKTESGKTAEEEIKEILS